MSEYVSEAPILGPRRHVSVFEYWPGWLFYTPVVIYWLWLGLRHGNFTLATAANPHIESGGLCGESKVSILDQVTGDARALVAPYATLTTGADDHPRARALMADRGLGFPVVVKPDIGCHGAGVRLVGDDAALGRVLAEFPRGVVVLLQEFIPFDGEAGVFYVRKPGEARGRITSLTIKQAPILRGDGRRTTRTLILDDPRLRKTAHLLLPRLGARADAVPASGERIRLVFTGNHCKGSEFRDGHAAITPALADRIETVCRSLPDFHFGRIDLRYRDIASLRAGLDLRIIEINGVGSEATHIWDPDTRLGDAYRVQFAHYRAAFEIGAAMAKRGFRPTGPIALAKLWLRQGRLIASYPPND